MSRVSRLDKRPEWPLLLLELLVERVRRTEPIEAQLDPESLEADRLISAHRLVREELAVAIDTIVDRLHVPTDFAGARIATPLSWALFGLALERTSPRQYQLVALEPHRLTAGRNPRSEVTDFERGLRNPRLSTMVRLARALDVLLIDLIDGHLETRANRPNFASTPAQPSDCPCHAERLVRRALMW